MSLLAIVGNKRGDLMARFDFSKVTDEQWKRAADNIKKDVEDRKAREKRKEIKLVK